MIDNEYLGVYILIERIKRDNNRVDVAKLDFDDLAGDSLTGGYIVKIDKMTGEVGYSWPSNYNTEVLFQFHDPEFDQLNPIQSSYMETFVGNLKMLFGGLNLLIPLLDIQIILKQPRFMTFSFYKN